MTLVLSRSDAAGLVEPYEVVDLVERAHADLARGRAVLGSPTAMPLEGTDRAFIPMSAVSSRYQLAAVKLLADMPSNRQHGLSAQRSTVALVSTETGECEAVLDGWLPTQMRTAAVSAVATRHLARPDGDVLGLIGAGALAYEHVRALRVVRDVRTVHVWSRSGETAQRFARSVADGFGGDVDVVVAATPAEVVAGSSVLCTLTPSRTPIVEGAWMRPGAHVNAVGAPPRPDHREIDSIGMKRARVVVDSRLTVHETGDLVIPLREGAITDADLVGDLGQVVVGDVRGRRADDDITLFKSVGIGLQDLAICQLIVARARERGLGHEISLTA